MVRLRSIDWKGANRMKALKGVAVSPGYAEGALFVYQPPALDAVARRTIAQEAIDAEFERFCIAIDHSVEEVSIVREQVCADVGETEAAIFDAHVAMLCDPALKKNIRERLESGKICAEAALADEMQDFTKQLGASKSDYLRELTMDAYDVGNRLLRHLTLDGKHNPLAKLPPSSIIVARNLMPSETVGMDRKNVAGIATEQGGPTSHTAILARSLGIPAVTRVDGLLRMAEPGLTGLLDGSTGTFVLTPSEGQLQRFNMQRQDFEQSQSVMRQMESQDCQLKDGTRIRLLANINDASDVGLAKEHNLDGIGLYRTELLYLPVCSAPGTAIQYRHYKRAAIACGMHPVTIRTFDFAVDKHPCFLAVDAAASLQLRGLRFALRQPRLFKTQLRAIVRTAREYPNMRVLFPMVTSWWELKEALGLVRELAEVEKLDHPIPIGAMIETPAAIFALPEIIDLVDFLSIGCSDLAQYTLAMERTSTGHSISECTLHPALLRAIQQIVDIAERKNCPLSLCGEAASDPLLTAVFVGLGIREFSVSPARAPVVRYALRQLSLDDAVSAVECAMRSDPFHMIDELLAVLPEELLPILAMEAGHEGTSRKTPREQALWMET